MAILKIKTYPDRVLKTLCEPVKNIDGRVMQLVTDMAETMYDAEGVGLAAPQVGISRKLIIVDTTFRENGTASPVVIMNPEIVYAEGQETSKEGCLSLPRFTGMIERKSLVFVRGIGLDGNSIEIEATGLFSRALQHEIDHLNGVLIVDKVAPEQKLIYAKNRT